MRSDWKPYNIRDFFYMAVCPFRWWSCKSITNGIFKTQTANINKQKKSFHKQLYIIKK